MINLLPSKGRRRRVAIPIGWVFGQDLAHITPCIEVKRCRMYYYPLPFKSWQVLHNSFEFSISFISFILARCVPVEKG